MISTLTKKALSQEVKTAYSKRRNSEETPSTLTSILGYSFAACTTPPHINARQ